MLRSLVWPLRTEHGVALHHLAYRMHTVTGYFNGIKKNTQYEKKPAYIYYLHTVVPKKMLFQRKKKYFHPFHITAE